MRRGFTQKEASGRRTARAGFRPAAAALAALVSAGLFVQPAAAAAGPTEIPEGYTKEQYAGISDSSVGWDEIEDRIICFNPTYRMYYEYAMSSVNDIRTSAGDFSSGMMEQIDALTETERALKATRDALLASPEARTEDGRARLAAIEEGIAAAESGKAQIRSSVTSTALSMKNVGRSVDVRLSSVKVQLTNVVQGLIISCRQMENGCALAQQQTALFDQMVLMRSRMMNEGLATAYDVSQAQLQADNARKLQADLESGLRQIRSAIGQQLGYDAGEEFVIERIPDPDLAAIDAIDPEADRQKAFRSNSEITAAMAPADGSQAAADVRNGNVNILRGRLDAAVDTLYSDLKAKRLLYEAAGSSAQLAEHMLDSAERQYALGLTGEPEYLGAKLQAVSEAASVETARLDLIEAYRKYQWALRGIVDLN